MTEQQNLFLDLFKDAIARGDFHDSYTAQRIHDRFAEPGAFLNREVFVSVTSAWLRGEKSSDAMQDRTIMQDLYDMTVLDDQNVPSSLRQTFKELAERSQKQAAGYTVNEQAIDALQVMAAESWFRWKRASPLHTGVPGLFYAAANYLPGNLAEASHADLASAYRRAGSEAIRGKLRHSSLYQAVNLTLAVVRALKAA